MELLSVMMSEDVKNTKVTITSTKNCFCCDDDVDNNDSHVLLRCQCILHLQCLKRYIYYAIGDRLSMNHKGIKCPYGSECNAYSISNDTMYITIDDLFTIIDLNPNDNDDNNASNSNDKKLTRDIINDFSNWLCDEQSNKDAPKYTDSDYNDFIISTTKACPSCGYRSTHYHGHQCHHISPARPPNRGGCPNCHINYCYKCLSTEKDNIKRHGCGHENRCKCGYWSTFCKPLTSCMDITQYLAINDGGIPYDIRCGCIICSDCKAGVPCPECPGDCCVCKGYVKPSPKEITAVKGYVPIYATPIIKADKINNLISIIEYCRQGDRESLARIYDTFNVTTINRVDCHGRTALMVACDVGYYDCVSILLSCPDINVNMVDINGKTAMHWATTNGHIRCLQLLLSHPMINTNIISNSGETALSVACDKGRFECMKLIISHNSTDINAGAKTPIYGVVKNGDVKGLKLLLGCADIDVNKINSSETTVADDVKIIASTALTVAIYEGHITCLRLLLKHSTIDVNRVSFGVTPLELAKKCGNNEFVRILLAQKGIKR